MNESARIAGRYEPVGAPLRGSMGELFRAYDTRLDREVAVKVIHRDLLGGDLEEELVRRFRREARLLARAAHPGVPTVFDFGHDKGRDFVVMELVDGATLGDLINEVVPVPVPWIAFIAAQIGVILAWAHRQSLVHRDLKPDNIILCPEGLVKIVDFGTAIASDGLSSRLTPPGITAGEAFYQAPERQLGLSTPRTDLYAVGRVLQEMIRHHPSVPAALDMLVADLMHELPQHRPADADEIERRVRPLLGPLPRLPGFVDRAPAEPIRRYAELTARLTGPAAAGATQPSGPKPGLDARQARALAETHAREGRHSSAIKILERAIDRAGAKDSLLADLHRDLATVLLEAGETTRAIVACQKAIAVMRHRLPADHPAVLGLRLALARAHAARGDISAATEVYLTVLNDAGTLPDTVTPRQELAVQYAASGDHNRAVALLEGVADELTADRDLARLAAVEAALSMVRFASGATAVDP